MTFRPFRLRATGAARAAVIAAVALLASVVVFASPAHAAVIDGAITDVSIEETSAGITDTVTVDLDWTVPDEAQSGDTFTLTLPDSLSALTSGFDLLAPNGEVIAHASVSGGVITFTVTDFVDTHDEVSGTAFFHAKIGSNVTPGEDNDFAFDTSGPTFHDTVFINDVPTGNHPDATKYGRWTDGQDQGILDPIDALFWRVNTPEGPYDNATLSDSPGPGQEVDCSNIDVTLVTGFNAIGDPVAGVPVDPSNYTVSCTTSSIQIAVNQHVIAGNLIQFAYYTSLTDGATGTDYPNDAHVTIDGTKSWDLSYNVKRTNAGGEGDGKQRVSVGDFVWVDTNRDGIQDAGEPGIAGVKLTLTGPDGQPVTDVKGNPVAPTTTDANGAYTFDNLPILTAGQSYTVTIDQSSAALNGYVPTVTGAGTTATDSSTGSATSGNLVNNKDRDPTLDFGFVLPAVSVGDFVWVDTNRDGIQDAGEPGIAGVKLTLTGPDGQPVTDVKGNPVAPTTTDANGAYTFDNLPILTAGQSYTVTIDQSSPALAGLLPTVTGAGTPATDSSTGSATSGDLTHDGDRDPTLDFGFVVAEPSIDIEKWSTNEGPVDGDYDTTPGADLDANTAESITFTITNDGNEPLVDVNVSDTTDHGPAVTGISCDFSPLGGPSTGTTWAGPFAVGDSFDCTGTLPGMDPDTTHADTASVTGTGQFSGEPVDDSDKWHGHTPKTPPPPDHPKHPKHPSVDIEKWSTDEGPDEGDHDSGPGAVLEPGVEESITFTITNDGNEPLVDVLVSDHTLSGAMIRHLSCDFSALGGPTKGTMWRGPFEVGDSFECTGVLPGLAADSHHHDMARVDATGEDSGKDVVDHDPWFGYTPPAQPAPPTPVTPSPPGVGLPNTGGLSPWLLVAGPVLLLSGCGVILAGSMRRRRNTPVGGPDEAR